MSRPPRVCGAGPMLLRSVALNHPSRRQLLVSTAAGGLFAPAAAKAETMGHGNDPGPAEPTVAGLNPSAFAPPSTDHGDMPNFKYSFGQEYNRRTTGGWARQVTVRDFPIAKSIAGVDMRLEAGAIRELHWHLPSEWAYVTFGERPHHRHGPARAGISGPT